MTAALHRGALLHEQHFVLRAAYARENQAEIVRDLQQICLQLVNQQSFERNGHKRRKCRQFDVESRNRRQPQHEVTVAVRRAGMAGTWLVRMRVVVALAVTCVMQRRSVGSLRMAIEVGMTSSASPVRMGDDREADRLCLPDVQSAFRP